MHSISNKQDRNKVQKLNKYNYSRGAAYMRRTMSQIYNILIVNFNMLSFQFSYWHTSQFSNLLIFNTTQFDKNIHIQENQSFCIVLWHTGMFAKGIEILTSHLISKLNTISSKIVSSLLILIKIKTIYTIFCTHMCAFFPLKLKCQIYCEIYTWWHFDLPDGLWWVNISWLGLMTQNSITLWHILASQRHKMTCVIVQYVFFCIKPYPLYHPYTAWSFQNRNGQSNSSAISFCHTPSCLHFSFSPI